MIAVEASISEAKEKGDKNGPKKMLDNYRAEEKEVKRMLDNANKKNANKEANAGMKGKISSTGMKK